MDSEDIVRKCHQKRGRIRDPRSGIRKKFILDPDPGGKKARIPDPDPQHWCARIASLIPFEGVH
jgi:hypothetical protein